MAATPPDGGLPGRLEMTLEAYETHAERYAERSATISMAPQIQQFTDITRRGVVLDAGCGSGRDLAPLSAAGLLPVGADRSRGLLVAAAAARRPLTRCDLRALPFGAAVFDGIWACASLVHFDLVDISAVLVEFRRVAKTGSALFVTVKTGDDVGAWVPTEFGARWFHFWRPGTLVATIVAARFEVHSAVLDKDIWVDVFAHAV